MERYDAILEQLKQAQRRGMDTISDRLDLVVQNLDELIQGAKTSVQEALPQTAEECLPVDEVEEALRALNDEAEAEHQRAADLEARVMELEGAAGAAQPAATLDLLRTLDQAGSQSELLKELLPAISAHAARAVVLVLREGKVSAWSGIGFTDGERLRAWQGDAAESTALATLLEQNRPVHFAPDEDEFFAGWLTDEEKPRDILLIPVALRNKLMGAVYVDRLEGQPWNPGTAQSLVAQVCWLIDTLQFRQTAAPSLAEPTQIEAATKTVEVPEETVEAQAETVETPEEPAEIQEESVEVPDETIEDHEESIEERVSDPHAVTAAISSDELPEEPDEDHSVEGLDADEISATAEGELEPEEPDHEAVEEEPATEEIDPSATMKIDLSELPTTFEPEVEEATAETDDDTEIASESFEPDEPAEGEFEPPVEDFEADPVADEVSEEVEAETEAIPTEVQVPVTPPEVVEEDEPEPEEEPEPEDEQESQPSKFPDEPPPVQPVQPPPEEPDEEMTEDEAQQEEARRFARLLVSEIKLYNEEQVERGREAKDLYSRLREDIDRSREMFDKRISEEIREKQDFFQNELVRILADGDPDVFGS